MSRDPESERIVRAWLADGRTGLPDHVLDAVLDRIPSLPQKRSGRPEGRYREMFSSTRTILASAAAVLVLVVGISLAPNLVPAGGVVATATPSPTATPSATATPSVAASESPAPGTSEPPLLKNWGRGYLDGRTYLVDSPFPVAFTLDVPSTSTWAQKVFDPFVVELAKLQHEAGLNFWNLGTLYADPCQWRSGLLDPPVGATVDEMANALASMPGLEMKEPVNVTIDGRPAAMIEYDAPASTEHCDGAEMHGWPYGGESLVARLDCCYGAPSIFATNERGRLYVVDVDGSRLVIRLWYFPQNEARDLADLEGILASVRFR